MDLPSLYLLYLYFENAFKPYLKHPYIQYWSIQVLKVDYNVQYKHVMNLYLEWFKQFDIFLIKSYRNLWFFDNKSSWTLPLVSSDFIKLKNKEISHCGSYACMEFTCFICSFNLFFFKFLTLAMASPTRKWIASSKRCMKTLLREQMMLDWNRFLASCGFLSAGQTTGVLVLMSRVLRDCIDLTPGFKNNQR